ncbi:hypothetical protein IWW51_001544 [Coemansia sp. RSA 2702]|nr:hypothetical protein IWW51_001544 [Coemansia sp. RSA 2702]
MALYSKQDLKDSQELYQSCEFISKKTRSIYAWRAALWVRYCKEHGLDFSVTEDKLIDYLDWLFEIDLVNKINTKKSYVPDILRDHMGSVICLWRIQTGNNPDLVSPKEGTRYQAKWDEILRNYPRRERFQSRQAAQDTNSAELRASSSGMAMSPRMHAGYSSSYGDAPYHHYSSRHNRYHGGSHHHQLPPQPQPHHPPMSPGLPQYHHHDRRAHSRSPRMPGLPPPPLPQQPQLQQRPVGVPDATELQWQLRWTQDLSWGTAAARLVFTTSMSTWTDAADATNLRLGDVYFAASTLAPLLPSSVLRLVLTANTITGVRPGPSGAITAAGSATRQQQRLEMLWLIAVLAIAGQLHAVSADSATEIYRQIACFSVIRARNPLQCLWNALGTMLFYHWHVANSPPPTFADTAWQNSLVLPMQSSDAAMLSAAAMETGHISPSERLGLVRDLLPSHKLPVESVVRRHSLDHARHLASPGSATGPEPGDLHMLRRGQPSTKLIAPLSDAMAPERLVPLSKTNSGYYEPHHRIQRHKTLPSEQLQSMVSIFR